MGISQDHIRERYPAVVVDWDDQDTQVLIASIILDVEQDIGTGFAELTERASVALAAHRLILRQQEHDGDLSGKLLIVKAGAGGVAMDFLVPPPDRIPTEFQHYYTTQPGIDYLELVSRVRGQGVRLVK